MREVSILAEEAEQARLWEKETQAFLDQATALAVSRCISRMHTLSGLSSTHDASRNPSRSHTHKLMQQSLVEVRTRSDVIS